jgi:hypothetical protein
MRWQARSLKILIRRMSICKGNVTVAARKAKTPFKTIAI